MSSDGRLLTVCSCVNVGDFHRNEGAFLHLLWDMSNNDYHSRARSIACQPGEWIRDVFGANFGEIGVSGACGAGSGGLGHHPILLTSEENELSSAFSTLSDASSAGERDGASDTKASNSRWPVHLRPVSPGRALAGQKRYRVEVVYGHGGSDVRNDVKNDARTK